MTPYEIALSYLGEQEVEGSLHNQVIVAMFASVGHPEIHDDETAWCAAFVGHCIEVSGLKSTRALNARSYRSWGDPVPDIELAREGDIVVFKRGNSTWQGHVGFFVGDEGNQIAVLGGNQGNAVSIAHYRKDKLLAIRRPPHAPSSDPIRSDPRARGHSRFPSGLKSDSRFQNGGLNERRAVCVDRRGLGAP